MRIRFENKNQLNNIHIHDSEFAGYCYDYDKRQVCFSCNNIFDKKVVSFVFENVVLLHLQSCSFWHGGNSILWMSVLDKNEYLEELISQQLANAEKFKSSYLDRGIQYVALEFTIHSGDTLLIICESISYSESSL